MTANHPPVKLCMNCSHLKQRDCTHPSNMARSFIDGAMSTANTVQFVRTYDKRPSDGVELCGPSARFHERETDEDKINAFANAGVKREQLARHEGRPEHDTDTCGRQLEAGS